MSRAMIASTPQAAVPSPPLLPETSYLQDRALVLAWARAHGIREDRCADVMQETFLRLTSTSPAFPTRAAQVAWLRRVSSNLCVDWLRQNPVLTLTFDRAALQREEITEDERRGLIEAMRDLSEMQRLVVIAKTVESLTFARIAADLEVSIPTAKTHYRRAIDTLRARLAGPPNQEDVS